MKVAFILTHLGLLINFKQYFLSGFAKLFFKCFVRKVPSAKMDAFKFF